MVTEAQVRLYLISVCATVSTRSLLNAVIAKRQRRLPRSHTHTRICLTQTINLRSAACGQHSAALFFFGLQADNQQKKYGSLA